MCNLSSRWCLILRNKLKVVKQPEAHAIEKHTYLFIHAIFYDPLLKKKSSFGKCEWKKVNKSDL